MRLYLSTKASQKRKKSRLPDICCMTQFITLIIHATGVVFFLSCLTAVLDFIPALVVSRHILSSQPSAHLFKFAQ